MSGRGRLWSLLPAVHRRRDEELGQSEGPLEGLLEVLEHEAAWVEDDVRRGYDDFFIETCADWVVPYLGALVGVEPVVPTSAFGKDATDDARERGRVLMPRREVANAIRNRRAKGTPAALRGVAGDVTGWAFSLVESHRHVASTPSIRSPLGAPPWTSVRDGHALEAARHEGAPLTRSADLRAPAEGGGQIGRAHPRGVALHIWPAAVERVPIGPAGQVRDAAGTVLWHTFNLFGHDEALRRAPRSLGGSADAPTRYGPRSLRAALDDRPPTTDPLGFAVWIDEARVAPDAIGVCSGDEAPSRDDRVRVWVDPLRGRLRVNGRGSVAVSYVRCRPLPSAERRAATRKLAGRIQPVPHDDGTRCEGVTLAGYALNLRVEGEEAFVRDCEVVSRCVRYDGERRVEAQAGVVTIEGTLRRLIVQRSQIGALQLAGGARVDHVVIEDSIVDGGGGAAITLEGATVQIVRSTVLGDVRAAHVERVENGIVEGLLVDTDSPEGRPAHVGASALVFVSREPGTSGYCVLHPACPEAVRRGGTDGAEPGAYYRGWRPYREANLAARVREFVPSDMRLQLVWEDREEVGLE